MIYRPITADLDGENWCLNFPVVRATSDLGLILVNHTVILAADEDVKRQSAARMTV